ncbi:SEA complex subunit [Komagataella phaffii]|uniref:RING-type domain-containing protein n=1 Tax=Komagataella phaffii (strain GS115 / ATCC 20864) TaxID=644223 RepID=C4QVL2_KOMPG|nr:uncharacterized protein PAS_chr1-3_0222 [Komagataella phaffii GS115]CAY67285.1 Putative protein of unknown function [Komagataella phaffii GS115]
MPGKICSPYDTSFFENSLSLRVDGAIGAMSLSPCSRDAVLAGRNGLVVIDLDDPFAQPRHLHHVTSWEVADVQWSPHRSRAEWAVSTSNQKALVWNLSRPSSDAIEHVLHLHTRAITDINFHPQDPNVLSTCSVDTFCFSWDLRTPRLPVGKYTDWRAAASQVKWNYRDPNILASAHNNHFYIWDVRKGAVPLMKVDAHDGRINGLDFSKHNRSELISCSNDMSVKVWDYEKDSLNFQSCIRTDFPVSRARHIPFAKDCVGIMPARGGNNCIYISNFRDEEQLDEEKTTKLKPLYVFKGHSEPVRDFLWRTRYQENDKNIDNREFQLVSWSKDCDLKLWPITDDLYTKFGHERNKPLPAGTVLEKYTYQTFREEPESPSTKFNVDLQSPWLNATILRRRKKNKIINGNAEYDGQQQEHLNWISGVRIGKPSINPSNDEADKEAIADTNLFFGADTAQPYNLGEEVSIVGHKFPNVRFEKISVSTGELIVSLYGPWGDPVEGDDDYDSDLIYLRLDLFFPEEYPSQPSSSNRNFRFSLEENHNLNPEKKKAIIEGLNEISTKYMAHNRCFLEPYLRFLMGEKVDLDLEEDLLPLDPFDIPYDSDNDGDDHLTRPQTLSDSEEEEEDDDLVPMKSSVDAIPIRSTPGFDSTPIPKGCGAVWTSSGHLVCFFLPKQDKAKNILMDFDHQGFGIASGRNDENFEQQNDDVESNASEDSFTKDWNDIIQGDIKEPGLFGNFKGGVSGAQLGPSKSVTEKSIEDQNFKSGKHNKNLVRIYDFRHLIPAKMELAFEYRLLGETPDRLAKYNAEIAEKHGYKELADCWNLLSVVLVTDVEIERYDNDQIDGLDIYHLGTLSKMNHKFFWGAHPFGRRVLVKRIIDYYEKLQNVQMLAMLSCILTENYEDSNNPNTVAVSKRLEGKIDERPSMVFNGTNFSNSAAELGRNRIESISSTMSTFDGVSLRSGNSFEKTAGSSQKRGIHYGNNSSNMPLQMALENKSSSQTRSLIQKPSNPALPVVRLEMVNHPNMDLYEDVYYMPLLDSSESKFKKYRDEYASLLFAWGLPVNSIKMLKFNYPRKENECSPEDSNFNAEFKGKYKTVVEKDALYKKMRKLSLKSSQDDPQLERDRVFFNSFKYALSLRQRMCHYCCTAAKRRVFVCQKCQHILHASCAVQWWEQDHQTMCPSGCGCECLVHHSE